MHNQNSSFFYFVKESGGGCENNKILYKKYLKKLELCESKRYGALAFINKFNFPHHIKKAEDGVPLLPLFEYSIFNAFKTAKNKGYKTQKFEINIQLGHNEFAENIKSQTIYGPVFANVLEKLSDLQRLSKKALVPKLEIIVELKDPTTCLVNKLEQNEIRRRGEDRSICPCCVMSEIIEQMPPDENSVIVGYDYDSDDC